MLRSALIRASESTALRRQVETRRATRALAHRYIAGERLEDGLGAAARLAARGYSTTLDYLGEQVTLEAEARAAAAAIRTALARIGTAGLPCGVSVKPSQLGLLFAPELCRDLVAGIAAQAARLPVADPGTAAGAHVTLDMEGSDVTAATVRLTAELWAAGHRNVGCALQSYLRRTPADVRRLSRLAGSAGASLRLCKGAYAEPRSIAHRRRAAVDASYAACATWLLGHGTYPRFATHDGALVEHVRTVAARRGIGPRAFEFQMLYGVRQKLQAELVRAGYRVRVYVPFGAQWYPYFMRRLAERPANVAFFLRSLRAT
jgi:proline dehydrogenase